MYIELLKEMYTNSPHTQRMQQDQHQKRCSTGRYHTAQAVHGMKIDGEYLSRLRFADDILICANTPHELQRMLQELADESDNQGLNMNKSKTKVMMENDTPIYVNNTQIENVESYNYLRQRYST